jgi:ribonuclease R
LIQRCKDFDDALSFKKIRKWNYEIGIHIADVSYYLEEGSILDDKRIKELHLFI